MPAYPWVCQVCAAENPTGGEKCAQCSAPAQLGLVEIARRRSELGLEAGPGRQAGNRFAKARLWLPGLYLAMVGLASLHLVFCGGDMCSMALGMAMFPWAIAAFVIPPMMGFPLMPVGFFINIYVLIALGRWWDRRRMR